MDTIGFLVEKRFWIVTTVLSSLLTYLFIFQGQDHINIERSMDSVVIVIAGDSQGTGFFFRDGCIMTASHVVSGAVSKNATISILLRGDGRKYPVALAANSEFLDMAILCSDTVSRPALEIVNTEYLKQGDTVYVIGHPVGGIWNLTKGIIARMQFKIHEFGKMPIIRYDMLTTAFISWGNSGGPVFDRNGNVVGMIVEFEPSGIPYPNGLSVATPGTDLRRFIRTTWGD